MPRPSRQPPDPRQQYNKLLEVLRELAKPMSDEPLSLTRSFMAQAFNELLKTSTVEDLVPDEVFKKIEAGQKIEAIKVLRMYSGLGLKESKELVEKIEANFGDKDAWA